MKKKISLLFCLCLLLITGCGQIGSAIRFGAADVGGMYYPFASAYTGLVAKDHADYRFEVKTTAGSAANLRLLSGGYIELGIAQNDFIDAAYNGTGIFKGNQYKGYKAVASLYPEACQIVVRADSDIETLNDLQGKTVSIGAEESGTENNAKQILKMSGLTSELVSMVQLDYTDAADKLASCEIDAFFCTAGITTNVIEELARSCGIRFLDVDKNCSEKLLKAYPFYSKYTIPAGTYTGQDNDVQTLAVQSVLLASDKLSTDTVKDLTAALYDHTGDLQYATALNLQLDASSATKGITIPFHPGAAAYYDEQGITVPTE